MTFIFSVKNVRKIMPRFKQALLLMALSLTLKAWASPTPIPVPPGTVLTGNPLRVEEYINSLDVHEGSDLAYVICQLPIESENFIEALDLIHPAPLQDVTFATNENMQAIRQTFTGRNAFISHGRCLKFEGLFSDHCNLGPSEMWVTPFGVFNNQAHIGGLRGYRSSTPGIAIGIDSKPNKNTILGFGLGYSYTDLHWKNGTGNADWHTGYFGVYGTTICNNLYLDAAVIGSYEFYKTKRKIDFSRCEDKFEDFYKPNKCKDYYCCHRKKDSHHFDNECPKCRQGDECCPTPPPKCVKEVDRNPRNRYRGYAILSHLGIGYKFNLCGLNLIPFASLDYDFVDQDGHREYRGRSLNLRVKANHAHLLRTEFGLTASGCIPYNCAWFRPSVTVSYIKKSVLQGNKFRAKFVNYPDNSFDGNGTKDALDYVAPGFGLEVQFSSQYIISFNYDAELNRKQTTQRVSCRFQRAY